MRRLIYTAGVIWMVSVLVPSGADAAFEFKGSGVRSQALAGACTASGDDTEAIWLNPAGIRFAREIQFSSYYSNLYNLGDLRYVNFSFILPTINAGTWGLGYGSFGPADYRETDIRLSFAAELGAGLYFGTNLKSDTVTVGSGGGSASAFGVDAGVIGNVNEKVRVGLGALNLNAPNLGDTSETLPGRFIFGGMYRPYDKLSVSFDLHKVLEEDLEPRLGIELGLTRHFVLRTGVETVPARFSFGFGLGWSIFTLNYAFLTHSVLESQHSFSLNLAFRQSGTEEEEAAEGAPEISRPVKKVDINTATVQELSELPGIGMIAAKEIVQYREKSGRFRSVRELMNIYGFNRSDYDKVKDYVTVKEAREPEMEAPVPARTGPERTEPEPRQSGPVEVQPEPERVQPVSQPVETRPAEPARKKKETASRIDINSANIRVIASIPGVSYPVAGNIVRYRKSRGSIRSWSEMLKIPGMNRKLLEKIRENSEIR